MSDNPSLSTGFARVTREILKRIAASGNYEVACVAWYHDITGNQPIEFDCPVFSGGSDFGYSSLGAAIEAFSPDVVVLFGDLWMIQPGFQVAARYNVICIGYFPVDGKLLTDQWTPMISSLDRAVTFTLFAKGVIERIVPQVKCDVIAHGVDVTIFYPFNHSKRGILRETVFIGSKYVKTSLSDKFVVGCVARNQPRKQLPLLIQAFSQFLRERSNAVLLLHTDPIDVGWNIPALLKHYDIADQTLIQKEATVESGCSDETLCALYNCMDVFALPTMGEGFGLPILEAMACGIPVVTTDWSAGRELVYGRGELIRIKTSLISGPYNTEHAIADTDHLVELFKMLHDNPSLREEYAHKGRQFAETLTWDCIAQQWEDLLKQVISSRGNRAEQSTYSRRPSANSTKTVRPVLPLLEMPQ